MAQNEYSDKIITPPFRLLFPVLFPEAAEREMKKNNKDYLEYALNAVFPLKADLSELKEAATEVAIAKWQTVPKNLKSPFKKGNEEKDLEKYPVYEDTIYIRISSYEQMGIADPSAKPILDRSAVYSGCWAIASVQAKTYGGSGTGYQPGVSFKGINIQLWPKSEIEAYYEMEVDDSALGAGIRSTPQEDFEALNSPGSSDKDYAQANSDVFGI